MLPLPVIDLNQTYHRVERPWTDEELRAGYAAAESQGGRLLPEAPGSEAERPVTLLASAIPFTATLSVAIHVIHLFPVATGGELAEGLLHTAQTNAANALHRCHRALKLDGAVHGYTSEEWLPVICENAGALLESSRLDQQPPSLVEQTQDVARWLAIAIACLDRGSSEAAAALAQTLAHLLVVSAFADAAREPPDADPGHE